MLSLFVLLFVLIIAIFKTIVFFICAISVFFDNMLNKIKSRSGYLVQLIVKKELHPKPKLCMFCALSQIKVKPPFL